MIMATIKSLLNKIKPGDPKEDNKELTEEPSKALKEIDVTPLLDEYSVWENQALKSLAETTSTLYQLKNHVEETLQAIEKEKGKVRTAASELAYARNKLEPYSPKFPVTPAYPWDSPEFIAFLGDIRVNTPELTNTPLESILKNVVTKDYLVITDPVTDASDENKGNHADDGHPNYSPQYINLLIGDACTTLGITLSLFLQGGDPILHREPLSAADKELIQDIIGYQLHTAIQPILEYQFSEKSRDELCETVPLFSKFINDMRTLHESAVSLLAKLDEVSTKAN